MKSNTFVNALNRIKLRLGRLPFAAGVVVVALCVPLYAASFAQMALPISAKAKGVLWVVLFGLAKTCQYGGLAILGASGWKRLKSYLHRRRSRDAEQGGHPDQ